MTAGLLELVSKGKKDVYFVGQPGVFYYSNVYRSVPETVWTQHKIQSKGPGKWGGFIEFELDAVPDLTKNYCLQIHLPSWLPSSATGLPQDASGNTYGYINAPAIYMFEVIEVYADTKLIQRIVPQWLDLAGRRGLLGMADGSIQAAGEFARMVGMRADGAPESKPSYTYVGPGEDHLGRTLLLPLPILGCVRPTDRPFPMRAVTATKITIRARIRKLDFMIESYPVRGLLPFRRELFIDEVSIGTIQAREEFPRGPDVTLLYQGGYVGPIIRDAILQKPHALLVERVQDEAFALEKPILRTAGDVPPMRLDFRGPIKTIMVAFQRDTARLANTFTDFTDGNGLPAIQLATSIRLITNGRDRFPAWTPFFYGDFVNYGNPGVFGPAADCVFDFGLDSTQQNPTGTINFSTAEKILLSTQIASTNLDRVHVNVFAIGYTTFVIKNGILEVGVVPGKDIIC